jgi:hypothetical protein
VTTTWQRFDVGGAALATSAHSFAFGGNDWTSGDMEVWGGQLEASWTTSSYIPAGSATVARSADAATFTGLLAILAAFPQGTFLTRATLHCGYNSGTARTIIGMTGANYFQGVLGSDSTKAASLDNATALSVSGGANWWRSPFGLVSGFDAAGRGIALNGVGASDALPSNTTRTNIYLGRDGNGTNYGFADGTYDVLGFSPEKLAANDMTAMAVAA